MKLAESYGALGIRVTSREEVEAAFNHAAQNELAPTLIEFIIEPEETVSRVTISLFSDDQIFEQIKKQLNRMVEV